MTSTTTISINTMLMAMKFEVYLEHRAKVSMGTNTIIMITTTYYGND